METVYKRFKQINNKGSTLVEVLISLILVGSMLVSLMGMAVHTLHQAKVDESRIIASNYADYVMLVGRGYCIDGGNFSWDSSNNCVGISNDTLVDFMTYSSIHQTDLQWTSINGAPGSGITYSSYFTIKVTPNSYDVNGVTVYCQAQLTTLIKWTIYGQPQSYSTSTVVGRDICK